MVIRLFCAAGMSTSLLVKKMEEAAKEKGKDADIAAYPFTDMERMIEGADVALLNSIDKGSCRCIRVYRNQSSIRSGMWRNILHQCVDCSYRYQL